MAKPWSAVADSSEYKALPPDKQQSVRQQYFDSVVAPNVPEDQRGAVQSHFMRDASAPPQSMSMGDVASGAVRNLIPSTVGVVEGMAQPIMHPIDTAESLYKTASGEVENAMGVDAGNEKYANAVNAYFANRYGSIDGLKKAIATDPAGVASDLSAVATFGGEGLARAPGIAGDVGKTTANVGRAMNPVVAAGKGIAKAAKPVANVAADFVGYLGTHTGGAALKEAAKAGAAGGAAAKAFTDHLRGNASVDEIVNSAKTAVANMRAERGAVYRSGMQNVSGDKTVLDFNDIDSHIANTTSIKNYKGIDISPKTAAVRAEIKEVIDGWKALDPAEYHTVEGMDALKQRLGDIRDSLDYNTPQRLVADHAYNAVRDTIVKQAPVYAKVMKNYEEASKELDEMQRTMSLGQKGTADTAARKLLSILRNNVYTNYGRRAELGETLKAHGAPHLGAQLAGETLRSPFPRGLGMVEGGVPVAAAALGHPAMLGVLPFMSPRLMGEAAHQVGKASRVGAPAWLPNAAVGAYGVNRLAPTDPLSPDYLSGQ